MEKVFLSFQIILDVMSNDSWGILQLSTLEISQVETSLYMSNLELREKLRSTQSDHILHHLGHKVATVACIAIQSFIHKRTQQNHALSPVSIKPPMYQS